MSTENQEQTYPVFFKHKQIASFRVGSHQFKNNILQLDTPAALSDFLREYEGLLGIDQVNIKQVLNLENERDVNPAQRVFRGSAATTTLSAAELGGAGRAAEVNQRLEEVEHRENVVLAREADIRKFDEVTAANARLLAELETLRGQQAAPIPSAALTHAHDDLNKNLDQGTGESAKEEVPPATEPAKTGLSFKLGNKPA